MGGGAEGDKNKKGKKEKKDTPRTSTPHGFGRGRLRQIPEGEAPQPAQPGGNYNLRSRDVEYQDSDILDDQQPSRDFNMQDEAGPSTAEYDVNKGIYQATTVGSAVATVYGPGAYDVPPPPPPEPAPESEEPVHSPQHANFISRMFKSCHTKIKDCASATMNIFGGGERGTESPSSTPPLPEVSEDSTLSSHPSLESGPLSVPFSSSSNTESESEREQRKPSTSVLRRPLVLPMPTPPPMEEPMEVDQENVRQVESAPQLGEAAQREEAEMSQDSDNKRTSSAGPRMQSRPKEQQENVGGRRYSKRLRRIPAGEPPGSNRAGGRNGNSDGPPRDVDDDGNPIPSGSKPMQMSGRPDSRLFNIRTSKPLSISVDQDPTRITACISYRTSYGDSPDVVVSSGGGGSPDVVPSNRQPACSNPDVAGVRPRAASNPDVVPSDRQRDTSNPDVSGDRPRAASDNAPDVVASSRRSSTSSDRVSEDASDSSEDSDIEMD